MEERRLITTGKAARALGIDPATLWRWYQAGTIRPAWVTPGGHARWDLDDLRRQLGLGAEAREGPAVEADTGRAVVAAVVTSAHGVLVGQRRDGNPPWTLIAGEILPGETPVDAAIREVKEETGLRIATTGELGRRVHPTTQRTMIYVAGQPADEAVTDVTVADDYELLAVRWVSLSDALQLLPGLYAPVREHLEQVLSADA